MKKTLLFAGMLLCGAPVLLAQTAFEWDFSDGMEGFTTSNAGRFQSCCCK